jgi:hypothetical protein
MHLRSPLVPQLTPHRDARNAREPEEEGEEMAVRVIMREIVGIAPILYIYIIPTSDIYFRI